MHEHCLNKNYLPWINFLLNLTGQRKEGRLDVGKIYLKRRKHWFHVSLVKVGSSQVEMYRKWAPCGLVGTLWSPCGHPGGAVQEMGTLWAPTLLSLLPSASVWPRKPQRTPAAPAANPIIKKPPNHPSVKLLREKTRSTWIQSVKKTCKMLTQTRTRSRNLVFIQGCFQAQ